MSITWMGVFVGAAGMYGLLALMAWIVRRYEAVYAPSYSRSAFNDAAREYMAKRSQTENDPA